MKISFRQTGGFAGVFLGCDLDSKFLPAHEVASLEVLIERSGVLRMKDKVVSHAFDLFKYTISIDHNGQKHKVTFDDLAKGPELAELVAYLRKYAKPLP